MNCLYFRQQASLYIDRQLDPAANQEFFFHINSCSSCFEYVDELKMMTNLLGQLGTARPPADLVPNIMANVRQAGEPRIYGFLRSLRNFALYSRPQYIAYAASFAITCFLFISVLYGFKPKFRFAMPIEEHWREVITPTTISETLPSVQSANGIVELTFQTYQQIPTKDLFVVAEVSSEGHAKLIELVDGPKNPRLERHVAAALQRASFKPATKAGRPVNSRMLLLIQTIDVRG